MSESMLNTPNHSFQSGVEMKHQKKIKASDICEAKHFHSSVWNICI